MMLGGKHSWGGGEVLGRARRTRRALVLQPVFAWPVSWWLWSAADTGVAVAVLWLSTLACLYAIIAPMHETSTRRDSCPD